MTFLSQLRAGAWLSRDRVTSYAGILLALEIVVTAFFVLGTHGKIVELGGDVTTDFASFYAAGKLAAEGTPALAYDQPSHLQAIRDATGPTVDHLYFYYPPVFLLVCVVLAHLPYLTAFYAFLAATFVPYLIVGRKVLGESGALGWLLVLASPAVYWAGGLGQNSFLTAALFGGALLLVDRRPFVAGLVFGLLCYKPHFGLLIPVALAAGGHWRAFTGAAVSVAALVALSLLIFGRETWDVYLGLTGSVPGRYEHGDIDLAAFVTPFGGARLVDIPVAASYGIQIVMALVAAVAVGYVWRRRASLPLRAATLCAGVLVAVPVGLMYDMLISAVAIFWLIRAARDTGYAPWEKLALAAIFIVPLLSRWPAGVPLHFPLGPLASVALLAVAVLHARRELAGGAARRIA